MRAPSDNRRATMRPRPPSRGPKSGHRFGRLRGAALYRFRHTLQRVGTGTGSRYGCASSRCRPGTLRYRDPRPIKIRAPAQIRAICRERGTHAGGCAESCAQVEEGVLGRRGRCVTGLRNITSTLRCTATSTNLSCWIKRCSGLDPILSSIAKLGLHQIRSGARTHKNKHVLAKVRFQPIATASWKSREVRVVPLNRTSRRGALHGGLNESHQSI